MKHLTWALVGLLAAQLSGCRSAPPVMPNGQFTAVALELMVESAQTPPAESAAAKAAQAVSAWRSGSGGEQDASDQASPGFGEVLRSPVGQP